MHGLDAARQMRRWAGRALSAALLLAASAAAADPAGQPFRITDELGPDQIEELIVVTIEGRTVGELRISKEVPRAELPASILPGQTLTYQLCGYLVTEEAEGGRKRHVVNQSGTIAAAAGRELKAFNQGNVVFFLTDSAPDDGAAAKTTIGEAGQCSQLISWRKPGAEGGRPGAG